MQIALAHDGSGSRSTGVKKIMSESRIFACWRGKKNRSHRRPPREKKFDGKSRASHHVIPLLLNQPAKEIICLPSSSRRCAQRGIHGLRGGEFVAVSETQTRFFNHRQCSNGALAY
ncbi:MAG TPA: hypothetical protein VEF07_02650 [Candidatus Binataceae bacterium]|nr:hypothetical protein [Candidatus Binataceae bacterium]